MTLVPRKTFVALALLCIAAVGAALFTQYAWDMQPCPWCILQRVIFLLIAVLLLLAAYAPGRALFAGLGVLAAGAGIAAALYQHFVAAKSTSCNLTLADKIISGIGLDKRIALTMRLRERFTLLSANPGLLQPAITDSIGPIRTCAAALHEIEGNSANSPKEAFAATIASLNTPEWNYLPEYFSAVREQGLPASPAPAVVIAHLLALSTTLRQRLESHL